jgi:trimethylamine:corrinoid methyltransferase-like protein
MDQHPANNRPMVAVVMGVSGSGKTTVGILLAETLAGMALTQLVRPGAPVIMGSFVGRSKGER